MSHSDLEYDDQLEEIQDAQRELEDGIDDETETVVGSQNQNNRGMIDLDSDSDQDEEVQEYNDRIMFTVETSDVDEFEEEVIIENSNNGITHRVKPETKKTESMVQKDIDDGKSLVPDQEQLKILE